MDFTQAFKAQADNLKIALKERGFELPKGQVLAIIAQQYGQTNWAAMHARLQHERLTVRRAMGAVLDSEPDRVWRTKSGAPSFKNGT